MRPDARFGFVWNGSGRILLLLAIVAAASLASPAVLLLPAADLTVLSEADSLRWQGRYSEAIAAYRPLVEKHPEAACGWARCLVETGNREEALHVLVEAAERFPEDAELVGEQSWLQFAAGDLKSCRALALKAIELEPNCLVAHWTLAEWSRVHGDLKTAQQRYEWFIDFYNRQPPEDAESLLWVGRAAAQYARWTRNSEQFRFLVNQLYPDALEAEPRCWPARLEMARLFLEKYNQQQAAVELAAALALNPQAADIYVCRAQQALQTFDLPTARRNIARALEINSESLEAHHAQADTYFALLQPRQADDVLQDALQLCPTDERTLGRIVAARQVRHTQVDDDGQEARQEAERIVAECRKRNPHCGVLHLAAAQSFDRMRRYPQSARSFQLARQRMPQLIQVSGQLGLVYMRLGREKQARELLDESFRIDPFNVRVKNMLEVLDVLQGYAVLETDHFVIRFDRGQDELLARYVAEHLEQHVYPEVCREMGYEPEGKTLFEIFNRAKNTSGHSWFSARMIGLPYIGTVAACAGQMVAMTSPGDLEKPYHWPRVLKHEFIHVVNLQQTDYNVPHWFTEALAVRSEQLSRPALWNEVLAERFAGDELFTLDTINLGFIRPRNQRDWSLAYCQAELYAEYFVETYGDDALKRMLAAYAQQRSTAAALRECFGVSVEDVERGYREYLQQVVADIPPTLRKAAKPGLGHLQQALRERPDDPDLLAQLAVAYLDRKEKVLARKYADHALQIESSHPKASYVLARLYLSIGDSKQAREVLEAAFNEEQPTVDLLTLQAALALRSEDYVTAERMYRLGQRHHPHPDRWLKALAQVYLRSKQQAQLYGVLEQLADIDEDNLLLRKKLAQLAWEKQDFSNTRKWANQGIQIDVTDAGLHLQLARALVRLQQYAAASREYETAIQLDPRQPQWQFELADALVQQGQNARARTVLENLLRLRPDFPGADVLLESLDP